MLKNTIFRNPVGWAKTLAGTRRRYLTSSICTGLVGLLLVLLSSAAPQWPRIRILNSIIIFIAAFEMPLYYLRALRAILLRPCYENNADDKATDRNVPMLNEKELP